MQYGGAGGKEGGDFGQQQSAVLKQMENRLNDVGNGGQQGSARVATADALEAATNENELGMPSITGQSISTLNQEQETGAIVAIEDRLLKPPPTFGGDLELQALARSIQRDIVQTDTVQWDDIIGLDDPKRLLKEAVVAPLLYPALFTGLLAPWSGCLLFGPPGTGKTLAARAVAAQAQSTFFNISASSITSKFRGDSEKLVRVLFDLARHHAPSVIFFDEIDSMMGSRSSFGGDGGGGGGGDCAGTGAGGGFGEHEGSRRTKAELLVQMDGLSQSADDRVFVLAASNLPWQLDPALLRRLDKRVLVPLPAEEARAEMLRSHLATLPVAHTCRGADLAECARATEGYSGADLRLLSKEAAMRPVRRVLASIEEESRSRRTPGVPAISDEDVASMVRRDPVTAEDLRDARRSTSKSCGSMFGERYERWMREYGSA